MGGGGAECGAAESAMRLNVIFAGEAVVRDTVLNLKPIMVLDSGVCSCMRCFLRWVLP